MSSAVQRERERERERVLWMDTRQFIMLGGQLTFGMMGGTIVLFSSPAQSKLSNHLQRNGERMIELAELAREHVQ